MPKAIRLSATGGPETLRWEEYDPGPPAPGEARIRQEAIGLNFIDVYHRTGFYALPTYPVTIGAEGAGIVEAIGAGVTEVAVGDRVAYASLLGAYAEVRLAPSNRLVKLPGDISTQQAAGMMLKGMTVRYLLYGCYPVKRGDTILVHAAAGGVGQILCQWAKHLGATIIGTAGSVKKADIARANGCDHVILYNDDDFVARTREITGGRGVDVVYDSVGRATFLKSLDCVRSRGTLVSFGQSSGKVEPFDVSLLAAKGSLFLTRPVLNEYIARREDLLAHAHDLFTVVQSGAVKIDIRHTYPLAEAARAHSDLEARRTTGSTVLLP
ncbi:MAG: quinone oxidoreductase [Gammaproteobacteria bacterium]|nr:quinone oxidoreductase [Gammaproteobacteria bacterium]